MSAFALDPHVSYEKMPTSARWQDDGEREAKREVTDAFKSLNMSKTEASRLSTARAAASQWVALEKIHGANFSFVLRAERSAASSAVSAASGAVPDALQPSQRHVIRCAKRTTFIQAGDPFFGYASVLERLYPALLRLPGALAAALERQHVPGRISAETALNGEISVFGELFGGAYSTGTEEGDAEVAEALARRDRETAELLNKADEGTSQNLSDPAAFEPVGGSSSGDANNNSDSADESRSTDGDDDEGASTDERQHVVQREIWYSPRVEFACFDIRVRSSEHPDEPLYCEFEVLREACRMCGIGVVPEVARGTLEKMLDLPVNEMQTLVPKELGLPALPASVISSHGLSEGVVVRPLVERMVSMKGKNRGRAIVKHKSKKFLEISRRPAQDPVFPGDEEKLRAHAERAARNVANHRLPEDDAWDCLVARINVNRLQAVLSKEGRLPPRPSNMRIRKVASTLVKDALESVREEEPKLWGYIHAGIQTKLAQRGQPFAEQVVRDSIGK